MAFLVLTYPGLQGTDYGKAVNDAATGVEKIVFTIRCTTLNKDATKDITA